MLFASRLRRSSRLDRSKRNALPDPNQIQKLEQRQLLVGQVQAVVRGDNLFITGENSANQIEVAFNQGNIALRPKNGTRINGQRGQFVAFTNTDTVPGSIFVNLQEGDDTFIISQGVIVQNDVRVNGRVGNDTLGIDGAIIRDNLVFLGGMGDDRVSVENGRVVNNVTLRLSDGDDLVRLVDSEFRNNIRLRGAEGDDQVVVDNVDVTNKLELITHRGDDILDLQDARVDGNLRIKTRRDEDIVRIDDSTIDGSAIVNVGLGDDNLLFGDEDSGDGDDGTPASGNIFRSNFTAQGRNGQDNLEIDIDNEFRSGRFERNFENDVFVGTTTPATNAADDLADDVDDLIPELTFTAQIATSGAAVESFGSDDDEIFATSLDTITITGQAASSANLEVDSDGDGVFDDFTGQADLDGSYSLNIPLIVDNLHEVTIRETDNTDDTSTFNVQNLSVGRVVRMTTPFGDIDIALLDDEVPTTVDNFVGYFDRYGDNMIIHRADEDFVIQGGGFTLEGEDLVRVPADPPIDAEFDRSNVAGTLSMAIPGGNINGGTSEWFINTVDNPGLDDDGSGFDTSVHTVFGVLVGGDQGPSFDIALQISELPISDAGNGVAGAEVPLRDFDETTVLDGTVDVTDGSALVDGTGTTFETDLEAGDEITIDGTTFEVATVESDTQLTLAANAAADIDDGTVTRTNVADEDNFVVFSEIAFIDALAAL